jgi:hypothetical protein
MAGVHHQIDRVLYLGLLDYTQWHLFTFETHNSDQCNGRLH